MDKIKSLKEKYDMPNDNLIETFKMHLSRISENIINREQRLEGSNTNLQKLKSKLAVADETLNAEKQILNEKIQDLLATNIRLKELEDDRNALLVQVHETEIQRNNVKNMKPSVKDQHTMEHGKKKFEYYKLLTGIRWDFAAPKGTTKGYITNRKDHIHAFSYQDKECGSKLKELMWKEIENGTGLYETNDSDCNENQIPNK